MAHRSRLSQGIARAALACIICGCTEDNACMLKGDVPCSWVSPGLCSNPKCIAKAMEADGAIAQLDAIFDDFEEELNGDEGLVA